MKAAKEFFKWSKNERVGVIVLSIFLLSMIIGDVFFDRIYPFKDNSIHPDTLVVYQHILEKLEEGDVPTYKKEYENKEALKPNVETKNQLPFNPNDLNLNDWKRLGFSHKQAESLLKYKASLGGFKTKNDFASSYVVSEKKYKELEPYIRLSPVKNKNVVEPTSYVVEKEEVLEEIVFLDINSADSISLLKLRGIGPFYSGKIISYRNELGGYVSPDQLLEIWKFDSIKLQTIKDNIWVDTSYVFQLKINSDSINVLRKHPYIDWNHANAIINYRMQHGQFLNKEGLKEIVIFNDSLFSKLYPYISLD